MAKPAKASPEELINIYLKAFRAANPQTPVPTIVHENGYYRFVYEHRNVSYRRVQFEQLLVVLRRRANSTERHLG